MPAVVASERRDGRRVPVPVHLLNALAFDSPDRPARNSVGCASSPRTGAIDGRAELKVWTDVEVRLQVCRQPALHACEVERCFVDAEIGIVERRGRHRVSSTPPTAALRVRRAPTLSKVRTLIRHYIDALTREHTERADVTRQVEPGFTSRGSWRCSWDRQN